MFEDIKIQKSKTTKMTQMWQELLFIMLTFLFTHMPFMLSHEYDL